MQPQDVNGFWTMVASHFNNLGYYASLISGKNKHPYMEEGIKLTVDAGHDLNVGTLAANSGFSIRPEDIGGSNSAKSAQISDTLSNIISAIAAEGYQNLLIIHDPSAKLHALEIMDAGTISDRVLLVGLDYLKESTSSSVLSAAMNVTQNLQLKRKENECVQDAPFRPGLQYVGAVSHEMVRMIDIHKRLSNFFYVTIPHVRQRENEFIQAEIKALNAMGLNRENNSPWVRAINGAFPEQAAQQRSVSPFDQITYQFLGAKERFIHGFLIGEDIMSKSAICQWYEQEPESEGRKHELDGLSHFRIPGVIYSFNGNQTDDRTKKVYAQIRADGLENVDREAIIDRAVNMYYAFTFGQHMYSRNGMAFPYQCMLRDLEWVIANLDSTLLPQEMVLGGQLIRKEQEDPIYGEKDEYFLPQITGYNKIIKTLFQSDSGHRFKFYSRSKIDLDNLPEGTQMKAVFEYLDLDGYGDDAYAVPFWVGSINN